ncbi:MAG: hypothetical protein KF880_02330 [Ferruginibacter sp.]|nr:hypothetical protein [Ferruginibacter sp.]
MKALYIALVLLISGSSVMSQPPGGDGPGRPGERVEALYVAYITRALQLTSDEAEKFWPVHTSFDEEMKKVPRDLPELDRQQQLLNIKKKYESRFSGIIGKERTDEFYRKDAEFRKKLVERLKQSRQRPGPGRP